MRRRTGALDAPDGLRLGDHVCWTYSSDEDHDTVLSRYLAEGIRRGEQVVYYADGREHRQIVEALDEAGVDTDAVLSDGRLALAAARDAYLAGGEFDPDARLSAYREAVDRAISNGFEGLRVAAEATWIARDARTREAWLEYELRADLLASMRPFVALCAYDRRMLEGDACAALESVHALALHGGQERSIFHLHGEAGVLAVEGEVDSSVSDTVRSLLVAAAVDADAPVLDLSGLRFADAAGVRAIVAAARAVAVGRGRPVLRGAPPPFRRIWELLRLGDRHPVRFEEPVGG